MRQETSRFAFNTVRAYLKHVLRKVIDARAAHIGLKDLFRSERRIAARSLVEVAAGESPLIVQLLRVAPDFPFFRCRVLTRRH